jgi:photosystem II stability/assembly factor-like uncharacterized protein
MFVHQSWPKRLSVMLLALTGLLSGVILPASANSPASRSTSATVAPEPALYTTVSEATQARARAAYGDLPMRFERNQGQLDRRVRFAARGAGYALWLTGDGAVLRLSGGKRMPSTAEATSGEFAQGERRAAARETRAAVIRMKLLNANRAAAVTGEAEMAGRSNYFVGNDAARWRAGVSNYAKVVYRGVYRGVDMIYYGNGRELEYDFKVAAGANPAAIAWRVEGAKRLRVDTNGELVMGTAAGEVRQHKPVAYQEINGERREVAARYVLRGTNRVSFALGSYERRQPLVIDPVLGYSTYLGGNDYDEADAIAVDGAGNAYVTGMIYSTDFPTAGALQPTAPSTPNAFVTKINASGTALIYSTYLGGSGDDYGYGIAVDASGNAYVIGTTYSDNFPTANPIQAHLNGLASDLFVTKLNPAGTALVYSTYLGGTSYEDGRSIAVDANGNAYIAGRTRSSDFPTLNPAQPVYGGYLYDAFAAKLNPAGSALIYSTYLGGGGEDVAYAITADAAGNAYVTGATASANFPVASPLQTAFHGKTLFRSTDGGGNWRDLNTGLPTHLLVKSIAIDSSSPTTLYAATVNAVFKTTNGGASWNPIYSPGANWVAIDPADSSKVYLASGGVQRSTDGGASWAPGDFSQVTNTVAINPVTPATLYAGTNGGLYKSTNGGASWVRAAYPLNQISIRAAAIDPTNPATVYFGTAGNPTPGVIRTTDGGSTWQNLLPYYVSINSIAIDPTASSTIYAGAANGFVYKTTDGGTSWSVLGNGGAFDFLFAVAIDPLTPATVYVATNRGVFKSTDGGAHWASVNNGLTSLITQTLALDAAGTIYAGTFPANDAFVTKFDSGGGLIYSTYLGGDNSDGGYGIAADSLGNAYVGGYTLSRNFPVANALKPSLNEDYDDLFIAKLNASGTGLVYSTYLGGSRDDVGLSLALDPMGNVFVSGYTFSADFPVTDPARVYADGADAFIAGLSATGGAITYATYLGGHTAQSGFGQEQGNGVAVDASGNVYAAGYTQAPDFPVTPGALQPAFHGYADAFVAKIAFPCTPSLSAASAVFGARGGGGSVKVTALGGCNWQAASNAGWIVVVSAAQGIGNDSVNFEVRENPDAQPRSGTLTIGGQSFMIDQAGTGAGDCQTAISPPFAVYAAGGGNGSVMVTTEAGCAWAAQTKVNWITITSNATGAGSGVVSYTVAANPNNTARKATIRIGNQTLSLKQKGH